MQLLQKLLSQLAAAWPAVAMQLGLAAQLLFQPGRRLQQPVSGVQINWAPRRCSAGLTGHVPVLSQAVQDGRMHCLVRPSMRLSARAAQMRSQPRLLHQLHQLLQLHQLQEAQPAQLRLWAGLQKPTSRLQLRSCGRRLWLLAFELLLQRHAEQRLQAADTARRLRGYGPMQLMSGLQWL